MRDNIVADKSRAFALNIIALYRGLLEVRCPRELASQMLRSGTSIGANIREGEMAQSKADFIARYSIALKEANETDYWLDLLHSSGYIQDIHYYDFVRQCREIIFLLIAIIKKTKENLNN